jgi:hypothetical protein
VYTSLKKLSNILILKQEGTSRQERYMQALHATDALMDNRNMQEMIAYMQRFAKNLLFINPDKDQVDFEESWEHYFNNDILFLIANVSTKNVDGLKKVYDNLSGFFNGDKTAQNFIELVEFIFSRFIKIDNWYKASFPDATLRQEFTLYILSYLQNELEITREIMLYALNQVNDRKKIDAFRNALLNMDDIWNLQTKENIALREKIFAGRDDQEKLTNAAALLHKTFDTIYHATATIVNKCASYFEEAIRLKQEYHHDHNPHVALIITFLRLYTYAKSELNKVPERHLHFYYKDILKIRAKDAIPDQTFLIFELAKGFEAALIKKGTQVSAGKDKQNKELLYETEKEIVVNKAQVSSLHSIFIDRNDNQQVLNYYKKTFSLIIGKVTEASSHAAGMFQLFGDTKTVAADHIGFALSSTQLYLAKGERQVIITFDSPGAIEAPGKPGDPVTEVFDTSIIKLLLTGEKGWIDSDLSKNEIRIDSLKRTSANTIQLDFTISIKQEQAIIAYNRKLHGGDFNTISPILQCMLKYPLAQNKDQSPDIIKDQIDQVCLLQNLQVTGIRIMVHIGSIQPTPTFNGVRELVLENDESVLDNKKPFFPFKSVPKVGSSFFIGCKDFFYKDIKDIYINMEWVLPDNFRNYYQRYLSPYDINKFMASFSILKGKQWKKINNISLIEVNQNDPRFRSIKFSLKKLKQEEAALPGDEVSGFDDLRKNGTLRLKLNYPDFGHGVYPQLITSAVMEGARDKSSGVDYYKIIRQQLNDSVISIKYPDDIRHRTGKLRVIYDILEARTLVTNARTMMVHALSDIIRKYNIDNLVTRRPDDPNSETSDDDAPGRMLVNDSNLIDRFLGIFRKIGLVNKNLHYDKDEDELDEVADNVIKKVNRKADFIMPSDEELVNLIINETESAINNAVSVVVDEVLALKKQGVIDPVVVGNMIENEFNQVNRVINDMIAKKIATHLSVNELPPPPYTPVISNLSVSYTSVKELSADDGDKFFHISPTGVLERGLLIPDIKPSPDGQENFATNYIFPNRLINADINYKGMFFIGVSEVLPNQNLSLLFQLAEDPKGNDKKPPVIHWFYLQDNFWVKLSNDNIISDSTFGLQSTGIVEFSIPGTANNQSVLFGIESLNWICAAVENDTDAFPNLVDIKSQAVLVTFKDYKNSPLHLALPLEAEKIKTLVGDIPNIKKISQPVSSFNGKLEENDKEYYTRVSERLRHKSRAINNWDYERLVLEQFPSFYKVKCLNNYYNGDFAIGHVTIVPVADFRNKKFAGSNMLLPKINYLDLRNIEKYLAAKSSPFVKIHAVNPQLEHVLITCKVKFLSYVNKGFYLNQLNDDLVSFLTPWAGGNADTISFTAKVYASSIINFIDSQEYVDYVTDLVMEQYTEMDNGKNVFVLNSEQLTSLVETELNTGHSILVSSPKHKIDLVE